MVQSTLLIKETLITGHDSHYAGGIHLFSCLAQQLSSSDQIAAVHTFSTASKATLLHYAVTHGLLASLQSSTLPSGHELISWQQTGCLHNHVIVRQQPVIASADQTEASSSSSGEFACTSSNSSSTQQQLRTAAALLAAVATVVHKLSAQGVRGCVLLDVDTLQHVQVSAAAVDAAAAISGSEQQQYTCSSNNHRCCCSCGQQLTPMASTCSASPGYTEQLQQADVARQIPFMVALSQVLQLHQCTCSHRKAAAAAQHLGQPQPAEQPQQQQQQQDLPAWPLLVAVQNIHHLPFGPCGTAPRCPAVLQGWQSVTGVVCVSDFVQTYFQQYAVPLLPQLHHHHQQQQQQRRRLHVVHPAAFEVWAKGPFEDLGASMAAHIWGQTGAVLPLQQQQQQQPQQQQQQQQHVPVVGMLKLTREKGAELFLALAANLTDLQFTAVCADPWVKQQVAQAGLTNLQLVEPQDNVAAVLQGMSVILVPSILHEAFGMVVMDAMLHGLPVIVSAAGALPEAAAGAAAAELPVPMVTFPPSQLSQPTTAAGTAAGTAAEAAGSRLGKDESITDLSSSAGAVQSTVPAIEDSVGAAAGCVSAWLRQQRSWDDRQYPDPTQQQQQQEECVDNWSAAIKQVLTSREGYMQASRGSRKAAEAAVRQAPGELSGFVQWLRHVAAGEV